MNCGKVNERVRLELVMVKVRENILVRLATNGCQVQIRIASQTTVCVYVCMRVPQLVICALLSTSAVID